MNPYLENLIANTTFLNPIHHTINYNSEDFDSYKPHRIFTPKQKEACWKKASVIPDRDPNKWRYDAVGNPVLKALRGCNGPLCHEYDHILPHSKGGQSTINNCQILQTKVNRIKSNKIGMNNEELEKVSIKVNLSKEEMDFIEKVIYGDTVKPKNIVNNRRKRNSSNS